MTQTPLEKNHRILVVDDNEAIHDDFRKILDTAPAEDEFDAEEAEVFGHQAKATARAAFQLSFASQGVHALDLVRAASQAGQRYSLVFMDVRMPPGWDGLETAQRLWEVDPDLQVVICTAYSDKSWEEMAEKLGNPERVLILKKPFDTIEVLQMAHALTEKWSLLQAVRQNQKVLERTVSLRTRELSSANTRLESEITKHKAAAERVREQAMLLEKARDAIIVRDLDDTILFWNQGAASLYGWTSDEAVGQQVLKLLYDGPVGKKVLAARQTVLETGSWIGELSQKTKDGRFVTVECRWTLVRDENGRPKSVLAINSDITEKKQLETRFLRAQRLESIGTLAGGIAHDLNNILQPITLAMELFSAYVTDPQSETMLKLVGTNAQRAAALVQQVLSFARGVEGERICVRPDVLMEDIAGMIRETFPKTISFQCAPLDETWQAIGDPTQLHQVLLNLCVNARDAMPSGGTLALTAENINVDDLSAAAHPGVTAGRYVVFTVSDTGTGIPEDLREKIFDPFFTTKEQGKGTGLGLSTAVTIVRSHGGFITLSSEEDRGSSFRVFVPANEVAPYCPEGRPTAEAMPRGRGELVLVVEDEATIRTVLANVLERFGYRVLLSADGAEGLRTYIDRKSEINAVITDMVMPVMDGAEMIAELKKINPRVGVIATTGMSSQVSLQTIARLGVGPVLSKPCPANVLLQALREVLDADADEPSNTSTESSPESPAGRLCAA